MKRLIFALLMLCGISAFGQQVTANLTAQTTDCTVVASCLRSKLTSSSGAASITLAGTFSATLQFEASGSNDANYQAISCAPTNSTTTATSATATGTWTCNVAGLTDIRVRASGYVSGTVAATITVSPAAASSRFGSSAPVGSTNVLPTFGTKGTQTAVGQGTTSMSIPPPATISNGDALVLFIDIGGAASEAWTPPSGFTQLGSTLSSVASGKIQSAVFCKIAASESGNYVISWNNATGSGNAGVGNVHRYPGASCTLDGSGSQVANAATNTVAGFTTAISNDLIIVHAAQSETAAGAAKIILPANMVSRDSANDFFVGTFGNGLGTTPTVTINWITAGTPNTNDSTLQVLALSPSGTSATTPFISQGQAATLPDLTVSGGANFAGRVGINSILIPNGGSCSTQTVSQLYSVNGSGNVVGLICSNSGNSMLIDGGETFGSIFIGSGTHAAGDSPALILASGAQLFVTHDGAEDVYSMRTDILDNLYFGSQLSADTQEGDMYFNVRSGHFYHWATGTGGYGGPGDVIALGASGFIGGVPVVAVATPQNPTVTPTCTGTCLSTWGYKVYCKDINAGVTLASSEVTTILQASTLDGTHKNTIAWLGTAGCNKYEVFRSTASTSPATTGIIAEVTAAGLTNNATPFSFVDTGAAGDSTVVPTLNTTGAVSPSRYQTQSNCAGVGTAASPSVSSCGSASAGMFSCATNATGATCQVNTTAVTANSEIFVQEEDAAYVGTRLGVTCNTSTTVVPTSRLVASAVAGTSFTINLGTITTNPACFSYHIIN